MLPGNQKQILIALLIGFLIISVPFANKINTDLKERALENGDEDLLTDILDDNNSEGQKDIIAEHKNNERNYSQNFYQQWNGMNVIRSNEMSENYPPFYENLESAKAIRNSIDLNHQFKYFDYTLIICPSVEGLCLLNYNNQTVNYDEVETTISIMAKGRLLFKHNIQQNISGIKMLTHFESNQDFATMIFRLQSNDSTLDSYNNATHIKVEFERHTEIISESLITHRSLFEAVRDLNRTFSKFLEAKRKQTNFITTSKNEIYITSSYYFGNINTDPEHSKFNSMEEEVQRINSGEETCSFVVSKWNKNGSTEPIYCSLNSLIVSRTEDKLCIAVFYSSNITNYSEDTCVREYNNSMIRGKFLYYNSIINYDYHWPEIYQLNEGLIHIPIGFPTRFIDVLAEDEHVMPININPWIESDDDLILIMSDELDYIEYDKDNYQTWVIRFDKTSGEIIELEIYQTINPHTTQSAYLDGTSLCLNVLEGNSPQDYHAFNKFPDTPISYSMTSKTLCEY